MSLDKKDVLKRLSVLVTILLTGCASPTSPTTRLNYLLQTPDMAWLGQHLDEEEWSRLGNWVHGDLIPYVTELEAY